MAKRIYLIVAAALLPLVAGCEQNHKQYQMLRLSHESLHGGLAVQDVASCDAVHRLFAEALLRPDLEGERVRCCSPIALTAEEDEIWVVARPEITGEQKGDEFPSTGVMLAQKGREKVSLPLKHTDVKGQVCGYIATVEVTQQFANPFREKIEAVYVFPLPQNAAVKEFVMVIGERRIRGVIRERQEAEQIYREARNQGFVASLLTQERPNVFTQKVANIEPGKAIDVNIKYFNTLEIGRAHV